MLQFTAELLTDILFRSRGITQYTDSITSADMLPQALIALNRAYYALCLGGREFYPEDAPKKTMDWWWLRKGKPGVLTLQPAISAGTVAVTNNSTDVTFSLAPDTSTETRYLQVEGHPDVFRVVAHIADEATAILDEVYTGITASAARYKLMRLEYSVEPDLLRFLGPMRAFQGNGSWGHASQGRIDVVGPEQVEREFPMSTIQSGVPSLCTMLGANRVRFNRYGSDTPGALIRVEYEYLFRPALLTLPGTEEEPVVPLEHRSTLVDMALYYLATDKNDDKAATFAADARNGLRAMIAEHWGRVSASDGNTGKIITRMPPGRRLGYRWLTTGGRPMG